MDLTVPTITRNQVVDAIRCLGLDPSQTRHVVLHRDRVEAVCHLLNEDGRKYALGPDFLEVATTTIDIPITENHEEQT